MKHDLTDFFRPRLSVVLLGFQPYAAVVAAHAVHAAFDLGATPADNADLLRICERVAAIVAFGFTISITATNLLWRFADPGFAERLPGRKQRPIQRYVGVFLLGTWTTVTQLATALLVGAIAVFGGLASAERVAESTLLGSPLLRGVVVFLALYSLLLFVSLLFKMALLGQRYIVWTKKGKPGVAEY